MIQQAIQKLVAGGALSEDEARQTAEEILEGQATDAQIGGLLIGLRIRGETPDTIRVFAQTMRDKAARVAAPDGVVLDTCGTGGDHSGTFNISTAAAFIAAGGGAVVAKHGNRSATSRCGSADVLEELGVHLELTPEGVQACFEQTGVCFLFARTHHSAMRHVAGPRKELGARTIFNLLGPLSNPAGATHQLIGVFDGELTETYAEVLKGLGSKRALVVHGGDGLDEITTTTASKITELKDGLIQTRAVNPADFGVEKAAADDLKGGDAKRNAEILLGILDGSDTGPRADIAVVNAGAALYAAEKSRTLAEGVEQARESIRSGAARDKLEALRNASRQNRSSQD